MNKKLRNTKQRSIILQELRKVKSHPTADDVYMMVKEKLPRVSLGTVYRNLEVLSECNEIQVLNIPGMQKRFDGNPKPHLHVHCVYCDRVDDILGDLNIDWARLQEKTDYHLSGCDVQLRGVCPDCREAGR
ncbi:MAG: Fur family transcriptional regulator, partial [Thermodesulfobacteriota bacterium]